MPNYINKGKITQSELKKGMLVRCGDAEYKSSSCWRSGVVATVVRITRDGETCWENLRDDIERGGACSCSDLDHLYLMEEEPMALATMEVGTIVTDGTVFAKILAVLGGEGEEKVYVRSGSSPSLKSDYLKQSNGTFTVFTMKEYNWSIYTPTPVVETIEVNGKKYKTSEVTERLSELEEVE